MLRNFTMTTMICLFALSAPMFAAPALAGPPSGSMPLSQILDMLEKNGEVAYFKEVEWDDDGYWEVEYFRRDGSKVEIRLDPVTGRPRR